MPVQIGPGVILGVYVLFSIPSLLDNKLLEICSSLRNDEYEVINNLLVESSWASDVSQDTEKLASEWIESLRLKRLSGLSLDAFFQQYKLSSDEGLALMCLAEALMRVPDSANKDALISDKISSQDWLTQVGQSSSAWINISSFGLAVSSKIMQDNRNSNFFVKVVGGMAKKLGAPILRQAINQCMGILGKQFVMGQSIISAVKRSNEKTKYLYSFDMLGEAAKTDSDAEKYFAQYMDAIASIVKHANLSDKINENPSISVKISALHPRYEWSSYDVCFPALVDKIKSLVLAAKAANIGITLDAEESDRLSISLEIFKTIFVMPEFDHWPGFGLAVQAYLRSNIKTIDFLINLAQEKNKKIPVRLVKGAYWDTEIKDSQVRGLADYPVFTRKVSTDVHYLLCAEKMIAASDFIYPQFASHNAFTVAKILLSLQNKEIEYEFQCLHGMGQTLFDDLIEKYPGLTCRNYAPVGQHAELLPYLVRRLLENGANTSFVNQILDTSISVDDLIKSPFLAWKQLKSAHNKAIPMPSQIFGASRENSKGLNIQEPMAMHKLITDLNSYKSPETVGVSCTDNSQAIYSPADLKNLVCKANFASVSDVEIAYKKADCAVELWQKTNVSERANILRKASDILENKSSQVIALCISEAGKTYQDAIDEVREAVDFLRYYASLAEHNLAKRVCPGPTGELNTWQPIGRGVVLCISPWNFPLAIFLGQVSAALVAGNAVIAKPASQTIAIANWAVNVLFEAGLNKDLLHLMPGKRGVIGDALLSNPKLSAVMLTGSTATGKSMAQTLASRNGAIIPLIAETGGQNAMLVDSTALPEQVVQDVVDSAFKSAGQRCSALRVLYIQEEVFDKVVNMLKGAVQLLKVGLPSNLATDVGPLIDKAALERMQNHEQYLKSINAKEIVKASIPDDLEGYYFAPVAYEISSISQLPEEVFGPILHLISYSAKDLDQCIADINATEYGLTLGIHSRVQATVDHICRNVNVGNVYVNRNMVGAVVGVQPFGGEGLSGTGPKAGGPWYLTRLCREQTVSINTTAVGGNAQLMTMLADDFTGYDLI